jgi:hypothetical protein
LRPYLVDWFAAHPALENWQKELVRSVMVYEEQRLKFVNNNGEPLDGMAARGENWVAFVSNADMTAVFEAMHTGKPLTADLLRPSAVVLVCHGVNSYRGYTADVSRIDQLSSHPFLAKSPLGPRRRVDDRSSG